MSTRPITITHSELSGSPSEDTGDGTFSATRSLLCAWEDRQQLVEQILGDGRYTPQRYPHGSGLGERAYARTARVMPFDPDARNTTTGQVAEYTTAQVDVVYDVRIDEEESPSGDAETLITERLEPEVEMISLAPPEAAAQYTSLFNQTPTTPTPGNIEANPDPKAAEVKFQWVFESFGPRKNVRRAMGMTELPAFLLHSLRWTLTFHKVTQERFDIIRDGIFTMMGRVNNAAIVSPRFGQSFEAGTLLYGNPTMERIFTAAGDREWTITLPFHWRRNYQDRAGYQITLDEDGVALSNPVIVPASQRALGWNGYFRPDLPTNEQDDEGRTIYGTFDYIGFQATETQGASFSRVYPYKFGDFSTILGF